MSVQLSKKFFLGTDMHRTYNDSVIFSTFQFINKIIDFANLLCFYQLMSCGRINSCCA